MTIEEAANSLEKKLRDQKWFTAVGIGVHNDEPSLYLYVTTTRNPELNSFRGGWEGYHVEFRKMRTPHAVSI